MILGLIFAAIFVYIGVNLEPGLNSTVATITTPSYSSGVAGLNGVRKRSPIKWQRLMQILNIGGRLKCSRRGIARIREARRDYQGTSLRDDGIVRSAMNDKLQLTKRIMIVFAAMIIFGVLNCSAFIQRCIKQTLNIGRNLKWQCRDIAQQWEGRNDYQGAPLMEVMA